MNQHCQAAPSVTKISNPLPVHHNSPSYYTKMVDLNEKLIVSFDLLENAALVEGKYLITNMLKTAPGWE